MVRVRRRVLGAVEALLINHQMFPQIYLLLLLQAASLTLGAPRLKASADADYDGDGEDVTGEILNGPYSTTHHDGMNSNNPFHNTAFAEKSVEYQGKAQARAITINLPTKEWKRTADAQHQDPAVSLVGLERSVASPLIWDSHEMQVTRDLQKRQSSEWKCNRMGRREQQEALNIMYDVFNNLFGKEPLRGGHNKCFVAECQKWYFEYCQMSVDVKDEIPGARRIAAKGNPGTGGSCYTVVKGDGFNEYHRYFFGHLDANSIPNYNGGLDTRHCQ
ncbi:hypothetical protein CORC01_02491 [Colletotrichum orchidophilum]|uniref:Uncharacterized protein n=1 Tax=Colletotrichum orchidophilum TaxID=1209926 RepID=A0A1G4BL90_9PEZI|nr:uncharacterized protein CORC01_02491 [Colletotrichum orchidophilum]OHF02211.1 hypothetical protein CORC01_02491 [Colletotrichum orchidophilum]